MEKAAGYHRDIYSGMVASELAKEGYFGDEYRQYGFLCWLDNEKSFITAEKEEECAKIYVDSIDRSALVTPYVSYGVRVYEPEKREEIMLALKETIYNILNEKYGKELEKKITEYQQMAITSDADNILRDYYSSLNASDKREKVQALKWLAGYSKKHGLLSLENYDYLLGLLPETEIGTGEYFRQLSGFAWYAANGWKYYTNAFLPTTTQKLIHLQKEGYLTSGITSKKYCLGSKPVYELKADFEGYLRTVLDDVYLHLVQRLDEMVVKKKYTNT
jgi:hypothetical protein